MRFPSFAKSARLLPITLAVVALLALAGGVAVAAHLNATPSLAGAGAAPEHLGMPAIDVTRPGQVPAFTEADVRAFYTLSHGFPGGRLVGGGAPPIQSIIFMPASQAESGVMHHDTTGLPASALVCVVVVSGPMRWTGHGGPSIRYGPGTPVPTLAPITAPGYMVFDAATGNLLVYGFY
ncbi:MAG TPA: hypothetical protein VGR57_04790 [Ktedonobacterales bacterium]|nr:hypothetical protein [Ktedonobacterales bacterium]